MRFTCCCFSGDLWPSVIGLHFHIVLQYIYCCLMLGSQSLFHYSIALIVSWFTWSDCGKLSMLYRCLAPWSRWLGGHPLTDLGGEAAASRCRLSLSASFTLARYWGNPAVPTRGTQTGMHQPGRGQVESLATLDGVSLLATSALVRHPAFWCFSYPLEVVVVFDCSNLLYHNDYIRIRIIRNGEWYIQVL